MSRLSQFAIFLSIVIGLMGGLHWYFWARLIRDPQLLPGLTVALTVVLIALAFSQPLAFLLSRVLPRKLAKLLLTPVYVWMGMLLLLFAFLVLADVLRLVAVLVDWIGSLGLFSEADTRLLISRAIAGGTVGASALLTAWAMFSALRPPRVVRVEVPMAGLPEDLAGLTIAQLSDLHLGPTLGRSWLSEVVARVNRAEPDLVVITGDLVDGPVELLASEVEPLGKLNPPLGVFFVTGNHEFYTGWPQWVEPLAGLGLQVLANERVALRKGDALFDLVGVHDPDGARFGALYRTDLEKALAGRDPDRPLVLLSHQVRLIRLAERAGVDLMLSGHNHGGQIWPWGWFVYLQQPILKGLHRRGRTWAYVSRGTGFWGPPMRLGAPAEIGLISLVRREGQLDGTHTPRASQV